MKTGPRPSHIWVALEASDIIELKQVMLDRDADSAPDAARSGSEGAFRRGCGDRPEQDDSPGGEARIEGIRKEGGVAEENAQCSVPRDSH